MILLNPKSIAKQINQRTYTLYYHHLSLISKVMFKWEGLPSGIDEKWIEKFLFEDGKCVFFHDERLGWIVTRCTENGKHNVYGEPTTIQPYGINYRGELLNINEDCVMIRNNDDFIPTEFFVSNYAYRLMELTRTIDININAQKTPNFITGDHKQMLSLKNIFKQWDGFEPVIFGDKSLRGTEFMKVLDIEAPIVFPQLQIQKQATWNEFLTVIGMNNANTEKRERLISNEVDANNEHINYAGDVFLKARQKCAEQMSELFGSKITVERREGVNVCMPNIQNI